MVDDVLAQRARLRLIGDIIASLAHDFGQPLNVIRLLAESGLDACEEDAVDTDGLRRNLTMIGDQAERLQANMTHLVAVARGRTTGRAIDPVAAVEAALAKLRPRCQEEQVAVDWQSSAACLPVWGVPEQIALMLETLLANALEAVLSARLSRPAVGIGINCREQDGRTVITVFDDGGGMPANVAQGVQHPLTLSEPSSRRAGIGLMLTAGIVAQMGGNLEIAIGPDGTRVSIALPACASA